jgi:hypothetical protein
MIDLGELGFFAWLDSSVSRLVPWLSTQPAAEAVRLVAGTANVDVLAVGVLASGGRLEVVADQAAVWGLVP